MAKPRIKLTTVVVQSPELIGSNVEDQVALLSIENGSYYGIAAVGSRIWELISEPKAGNAICEQLLGEYEVSRLDCERQVLEFLQKLADANLVRMID